MDEFNPVLQKFILLLNGFDSLNADENSIDLELCFDDGLDINIHAAASEGSFVGCEESSSNAFRAGKMLKTFFDEEDSDHEIFNLPLKRFLLEKLYWRRFDSISLRKDLSKLTIEEKNLLVEFVKNYLKPGGILFVNYDSNPGYKPERLDFHRPLFFHETADIFSALDFACSIDPIDLFDNLNLNDDARNFLEPIKQPIFREQMKDFFTMRAHRRDIFIRGAVRLNPVETMQRIRQTKFILLTTKKDIPTEFQTPLGVAKFSEEVVNRLIEFLASEQFEPKTFEQISTATNDPNPLQLLSIMIRMNVIAPCTESNGRIRKKCSQLNEYLCSRSEFDNRLRFLASPITGGKIPVNQLEMMIMKLMKIGHNDEDYIAEEFWKILERNGDRLIIEGNRLESKDENISKIREMVKEFFSDRILLLKSLQVI